MCWHLPIVPGRFQPSIVGTSELNCRVRDGNGCTLTVISTNYVAKAYSTLAGVPQEPSELNKVTLKSMRWKEPASGCGHHTASCQNVFVTSVRICRSSPRSISTVKLKTSLPLHTQPINHVVFVGSYLITQWDILS